MRQTRVLMMTVICGLIAACGIYLTGLGSIKHTPDCGPQTPATAHFEAHDLDGHIWTEQNFVGQPTLLFFGFTYCPEVCPTTLSDLTRWMEALGKDAAQLHVVFVTVDPEHDSAAVLKKYLASFDPKIQGLILQPEQLAIMAKAYHVFYEKIKLDDGTYTFDHEGSILMLDRNGQIVDTVSFQETDPQAVAKLRNLLASPAHAAACH